MKNIITILISLIGLVSAIPANAAVAVRRQSINKTSQAPEDYGSGDTNDLGFISVSLGGVHSARIYADAQGNTHFAYKETQGSVEVELTPESVGFVYDTYPAEVQAYMDKGWKFEAALYYALDDAIKDGNDELCDELAALENKVFVMNANDFWSNAAIYLGSVNQPSTVNTTLTMTGGKVHSIVAAGERYSETGALPGKTDADTDSGNATINIQGGTVQFVATSVRGTKYFTGTVKIYMQNCTYSGDKIPNVIDTHCKTNFVATGVNYLDNDGRFILNPNSEKYCKADCYMIQDATGAVTCLGKTSTSQIELTSDHSPINCTTFTIDVRTKVSTAKNITATEGILLPTVKMNTTLINSLFIGAKAVVTTPYFELGNNATVTNLGTVNITRCQEAGYKLEGAGTWALTYIIPGTRTVKACNLPNFEPHNYGGLPNTRKTSDAVLGVNLMVDRTKCQWCEEPGATYGEVFYNSLYDVTNRVFSGTLAEDVVFRKGIKYSRTYTDGFQPLYLPFALSYDQWSTYADIYRINNIHEYDTNKDDEIDNWTLEIVKLKAGQSIKPNVPYVIKPKSAGVITLQTAENARIVTTDEPQFIDCSSTLFRFVFTGTPASKTITANSDFYLAPGGLCYGTQDVTMGTYRWYMSIIDRETDQKIVPSQFNAAKRITVFCEDDDTTGVLELEESVEKNIPADAVIYDLNGQKVSKMVDGKIYIVNGKKFKK